jgi:anti-anti-sigma regulatory factor
VEQFRPALIAALSDEAVTGLVVDLSDVTFLDRAGVGALVEGRQTAVRHAKRYEVIHPQESPRQVLK